MMLRTSTTRERFSRRALLNGLGASAAMLPLLHAGRAAGAGFPKRLVTIAWTNGVAQTAFYPAGDDPTAGEVCKPLAPFRSKVLMPCGIDVKVMLDAGRRYDGHFSYPSLFTGTYRNVSGQTGTATGPSLDQVFSDAVAKQVNLPMPLLTITASGRSTSYRGDNLRNTGETDPKRLFARLFTGAAMPTEQIDALRVRRKSVLDFIGGELTAFTSRLGTEDRAKIAAHQDSIRQLERQLAATPAKATCAAPALPAGTDFAAKMKAFVDMTAIALRCDLTRAVSMSWGDDGGSGPGSFPFLNVGDYHGVAHQGSAGYGSKIKIDTWYMTQLAALAKQLDETPEAGGTALDNSVIVMMNDMNEGAGHNVGGIPVIMVGSGGGYFKTGRAVKLGTWATKTGAYWRGDSGVPHNKLLASIANALDVKVEGFGASAYGGTLGELTR